MLDCTGHGGVVDPAHLAQAGRKIIGTDQDRIEFELPSRRDVKKCVVTRETVEKGLTPTLVTEAARDEDDELREESA